MNQEKFLKLPEPPKVGEKVALPFIPNPQDVPTVGEVKEVYQRGKDLWAKIQAARADGRIETHEVLIIISAAVEVAGLSVWQKIGRFFRNLFTRKK